MNQREVDWYSREYPVETMNITERASRDWANTLRDQHAEMREIRKEHDKLNRNLVMAARLTRRTGAYRRPHRRGRLRSHQAEGPRARFHRSRHHRL